MKDLVSASVRVHQRRRCASGFKQACTRARNTYFMQRAETRGLGKTTYSKKHAS